nr:CRISPR-associated protein Cas4 [Candidatus Njordarchaeota archaeon]
MKDSTSDGNNKTTSTDSQHQDKNSENNNQKPPQETSCNKNRHSLQAPPLEPLLLTVTDITQYYYCPRKFYFLKVLQVPYTTRRKMEVGKEEQERERKRLKERKDRFGYPPEQIQNIVTTQYIESPQLGLAGQIDLTLELKDGTLVPVEIKYTDTPTIQRQWKKQLTAYTLLLEHKHNKKVTKALLYFTEQNKTIPVEITEEDKTFLKKDIERLNHLLKSELVPRRTDEAKCRYCEVARYCT